MIVDCKSFIAIIKRAGRCKYDQVVMINHLLMQCYSIDNDSDVGMHYILAIPTDGPYENEIYDKPMILKLGEIIKMYNDAKKETEEERKKRKLKPKDLTEELFVREVNGNMEFKFVFSLEGATYTTATYLTPYPMDTAITPDYSDCTDAFNKIIDRLKPGGMAAIIDGKELGILRRAYECPTIYFHTIRLHDTKIRIPFAKSMFMGTPKWDQMLVSIQETIYPDIYLYTLQLTKHGITEYMIGYIQNF